LNHVNHLDLVGWINEARYKWAEIMGKEIKFRPATFYMGIVDMLAKNVEGQQDDQTKAENASAKEEGEGLAKKASTSSTPERHQREQHAKGQMVESLGIAGDVKEAGEGIAKDDGLTPKG
jgi:triacylglycerol lipase